MRSRAWALVFAGLLAGELPAAAQGVVSVSVPGRRIETSRLVVHFDSVFPEMMLQVVFKDWNPTIDLAGDITTDQRFFGQTLRNAAHTGFFVPSAVTTSAYSVTQPTPDRAEVTISSESAGEAPVTTRYTFFADEPWFQVDRTIHFASMPDTAAYQPYAPMLASVGSYKAVRYRTRSGEYVQRIYCPGDCDTDDWDGRWIQQFTQLGDSHPLTIATVWKYLGPSTNFVRRFDLDTNLRWATALRPAEYRDADETTSLYVAFSAAEDDTTMLDSLWSVLNADAQVSLDAPSPRSAPAVRLAASPNPSPAAVTLAWALPAAGHATLAIHDLTGRVVATLWNADSAPGEHRTTWNGRLEHGAHAPAGIYLARLTTPQGSRTIRLAHVR